VLSLLLTSLLRLLLLNKLLFDMLSELAPISVHITEQRATNNHFIILLLTLCATCCASNFCREKRRYSVSLYQLSGLHSREEGGDEWSESSYNSCLPLNEIRRTHSLASDVVPCITSGSSVLFYISTKQSEF
jgi:hypothetical protein